MKSPFIYFFTLINLYSIMSPYSPKTLNISRACFILGIDVDTLKNTRIGENTVDLIKLVILSFPSIKEKKKREK